MLDIKRIRMDSEGVLKALKKRHGNFPIEELIKLDEDRRNALVEVEEMKAEQNRVSKEIPILKKEGKDVSGIFEEMKTLSEKVKVLDLNIKDIDDEMKDLLFQIPNTPHATVVEGESDADNIEMRKWGEPKNFDFEPKAHWDLGTELGVLDFDRAVKIAGARFSVFSGKGARLERAIINFMLDLHTENHGYKEMATPYMVNRDSMIGTGQLPKFEEDMFHVPAKDFFLVPTAEVPLTNLLRDEILKEEDLPVYFTAYTPCFRAEAGSAGRDTRGLIRNHQFDKVEMVKFAHPDKSYYELESLTDNAEEVLRQLEIPFRVVMLSTGDLGFSSAKTYDIEVWMPSYGRYVEISSCSNFEDFQARRANLRYRSAQTGRVEYVHTLNGSGLAVGRTFAAILENYQQADGTVVIPEVLRKYMVGLEKIEK